MKGNALITETMLGIEDHGIMTCFLYLKQDGEDYGQIRGIGHITDNKWFYPETEIKKLLKEKIK